MSFTSLVARLWSLWDRVGVEKSVLLKMITGLMQPDQGQIWVDGEDITRFTRKAMNRTRRKLGMLFQSAALFDSMTVGENVGFMVSQHMKLSRREIDEIVAEKLNLVQLDGTQHLRPAELSGGYAKAGRTRSRYCVQSRSNTV